MASDKESTRPEKPASERFFRYFQHEITDLQEQMERLGNTALVGGERKDASDHCLAGIIRLSSEVKDVSSTLPAHDIRTYSEAIKALQEKLARTQAAFAPKQKFTFKTKKNASAISLDDAAELAAQKQLNLPDHLRNLSNSNESSGAGTPLHLQTPPNERAASSAGPNSSSALDSSSTETQRPNLATKEADPHGEPTARGKEGMDVRPPTLRSTPTSTTVYSKSNSHIIIPLSSQQVSSPCNLSRLASCCVDLSTPSSKTNPFASLTINHISQSLLLCGLIAGPAHITNVRDTTILLSCRQFRMHDCKNVDVYLYCPSRPIIENCTDIRFAPMPAVYLQLLQKHTQSQPTNLYDQVDDFKWLRTEHSPNWSLLDPSDQVSDSTWQAIAITDRSDIDASSSDRSLDEILAMAGVGVGK